MHAEINIRYLLQQELVSRCRANPSYSLRAFARALKMDPSTLAKILNGKRQIGSRATASLAASLGLSKDEIAALASKSGSANPQNQIDDYPQLQLDLFAIISDWYHFAILELLKIKGFQADVKSVGKALGISVADARLAVERLERVGLVKIEKSGKWTDTSSGKTTNIAPGVTSTALRKLQRQVLEKAIAALENTPLEHRDQSTITMAIDRNKLDEAKEHIKIFRRNLAKLLSRGNNKNEIYNLSVSLYPLTQFHERK